MTAGVLMAGADFALANGVLFGNNKYLSKGTPYTAVSNSKKLTFGFWIKRASTGAQAIYYAGGGGELVIEFNSSNKLRIRAEVVGTSTTALEVTTATTFNDTDWHNIIASFDMGNSSNRGIYVDDASDSSTWSTYTDNTLEWNVTDMSIAADLTGSTKLNADMAEFWLDYGTQIDLTFSANRRPFINDNNKPGNLGVNGSLVTGNKPTIYLSGDASEWYINKGYGGGFTLNGGALTNSTTSPAL